MRNLRFFGTRSCYAGNSSKYTLQEGLKVRSHGKTAKKGYQKAKELLPKLSAENDSEIKIFSALEAAERVGAFFEAIYHKDLNDLHESLYYYTFIRDFTSSMTPRDNMLEDEIRDLKESGMRNVALIQQKIEQAEKEKKRVQRIKLIQVVVAIVVLVVLCAFLYSLGS